MTLAPPVAALPPQPPRGGSGLDNLLWSLKMRYWAWRHDAVPGLKPRVRLFVLFFDPARHDRLPHSVGVERGMIGVINAFASPAMAGSNNVVISHELLHTLGATDKYDPATGLPRFPDGYAEPGPFAAPSQVLAEIMGGRTRREARRDTRILAQTLIGDATAAEIGWAGNDRPPTGVPLMIGVFDSGLGGLSVLAAIARLLPRADLTYLADTAHVPYGDKHDEFIRGRVLAIGHHLASGAAGCWWSPATPPPRRPSSSFANSTRALPSSASSRA